MFCLYIVLNIVVFQYNRCRVGENINIKGFILPNKLESGGVSYNRIGGKSDFSDVLKNTIKSVNDAQLEAGQAVKSVLSGESKNIHETMIALQKADVSLELMMEVRNKLLEAYQEIMRTQV